MRQAFILVLMCASAVALCTRMLLVYGRLLLASRRWASGPRGCETGASIRRCIDTGFAAITGTGMLAQPWAVDGVGQAGFGPSELREVCLHLPLHWH